MERLRTDRDEECYWRREMPISSGRVLLIQALARLCAAHHGHDFPVVALTFDEEGSIFVDEPARSQIRRAACRLGEAFAAEEVRTFGREFGGSTPLPLPPYVWELDDFHLRFATSALDPSRPFDASSARTHWIFVDERELDRFLRSGGGVAVRPKDATGRPAEDATASDRMTGTEGLDRFIRMPELEARTALSRATIYRRIAAGRFPKPIPMDGNISAWRDAEVADWLANPR